MDKNLPFTNNYPKGQSLLEIIVALAIFAIIASAIFTVVSASLSLTSFNRARITARHLAQEKIELIRNLPYEDVGTQGGIPVGSLLQEEIVNRNGLKFLIDTDIVYFDDPFDNTAPDDLLPTDYKRTRVEVSWEGVAASRNNPVVFVTDIAPEGVETTDGGGTLSILVYDANLQPVEQANIEIVASAANPQVNLNLETGANGRVILPGAPACISCYQITVTKTGYTEDRTYSISEIANPNKPHQTVIEGDLTEVAFAIDLVSTLNLASVSGRPSFSTLGNVNFRLRGTNKTLGTDSSGGTVYLVNEVYTTDSSGNITIDNFIWDTYVMTPEGSDYNISGSNPIFPVVIDPNTDYNYTVSFEPQTTHNLLLSFKDINDSPIASVSATLSDGGSFQETVFSGGVSDPDFGQVFFSNLNQNNYTLTTTISGFQDMSGNVDVSGPTQQSFVLLAE